MNINEATTYLDKEWDRSGFLGEIRQGIFDIDTAQVFLNTLGNINIEGLEELPKAFVSLLWYLPSFLSWQEERIIENGGDISSYNLFATQVQNTIELILGVP